jgi:hypothetical protein
MDFEWTLFMIQMGDAWREGRKLLDGNLRSGSMMLYHQMMQEKTREFLANLYATPKNVHAHIELLVGHPLYANCLLTAGQPSGTAYHVSRVWLRPEGG